jgi:hypothetical protein
MGIARCAVSITPGARLRHPTRRVRFAWGLRGIGGCFAAFGDSYCAWSPCRPGLRGGLAEGPGIAERQEHSSFSNRFEGSFHKGLREGRASSVCLRRPRFQRDLGRRLFPPGSLYSDLRDDPREMRLQR